MTLNEMFEEHGIYLGDIAFRVIEDVAKAYIQQELEKKDSELTEAKKIIRDLVEWQRIYGTASGKYQHRCDEARAFLKE